MTDFLPISYQEHEKMTANIFLISDWMTSDSAQTHLFHNSFFIFTIHFKMAVIHNPSVTVKWELFVLIILRKFLCLRVFFQTFRNFFFCFIYQQIKLFWNELHSDLFLRYYALSVTSPELSIYIRRRWSLDKLLELVSLHKCVK